LPGRRDFSAFHVPRAVVPSRAIVTSGSTDTVRIPVAKDDDSRGQGRSVFDDFGAAFSECMRSAANAVLDQQKAVWTSYRDLLETQLGGDTIDRATRETAKLMMTSFLSFVSFERDMRKRLIDMHVSFANLQIELLESHRRPSNGGDGKAAGPKGEDER
jgi:hypothetical protein